MRPILCVQNNDIEIMMSSETNEIIEKLFKSLLQRYQEGLEELMRGNEFIFDSVDYYITIFKKQAWKESDHHIQILLNG